MRVTEIAALFDYNAWANERILRAASGLTDEQFTATTRFPRASLRGCLFHVLGAVRVHLAAWRGLPSPPDRAAADYPSVAALVAQWHADEADLRAFLATLTDADLDRPRTVTFADEGVQVTAPLWQLMAHVVNHGTQHRSDAAQILTELGHSPGDLDMMDTFPATPLGAA
jgi:uncharacterized damage-inducible protein DinB